MKTNDIPTPRTDGWEHEQECNFDVPWEDHCRELERENARLRKLAVRLYNSGYHAGHHDTVEAGYVDIFDCDMDTYHAETVEEIISANGAVSRDL